MKLGSWNLCCGGCYTYFSQEIRNRNYFLHFVVGWFTLYVELLFSKSQKKMVIVVVLLLRTEMVAYEATFILLPMTRHSLRKFHYSIYTSAPGHLSISPCWPFTIGRSCLLTTCGMALRNSVILLFFSTATILLDLSSSYCSSTCPAMANIPW